MRWSADCHFLGVFSNTHNCVREALFRKPLDSPPRILLRELCDEVSKNFKILSEKKDLIQCTVRVVQEIMDILPAGQAGRVPQLRKSRFGAAKANRISVACQLRTNVIIPPDRLFSCVGQFRKGDCSGGGTIFNA